MRPYYSQEDQETVTDELVRVNVVCSVVSETESEISSHKPAPDCRNSEWDYADCAGHNRVAIGLRACGAIDDGSEIRTVRLRNLRAYDIVASRNSHNRRMGLKRKTDKQTETERKREVGKGERETSNGLPMDDDKDFVAVSFYV